MMRSRLRWSSPTGAGSAVEPVAPASQLGGVGRTRARRRMSAEASEPGVRLGAGALAEPPPEAPCVAPPAAAALAPEAAAAEALPPPASLGDGGSGRPRLIIISSANKRSSFERSAAISSSSTSGRPAAICKREAYFKFK